METKYDVFISYSRKDYIDENTKVVIPDNPISKIMKALDDAGITYWIDKKGIYHGDEFSGVIADAIEASNVFVFVSSEYSNNSPWTTGEIATAQEAKKKIIPVRIDFSRYHKSLRVRLNALDYIDFTSNLEENTQSLIVAIKAYLTQIKEEEERKKEEERRKRELERQKAEEAKRKQEEEAKRKQEEQQKLIDGIRGDCSSNSDKVKSSHPTTEELGKWNWGAFFLNWIWGLGNGIYWPLVLILCNFIPYIGWIASIVICIVLGANGTKWAWKAKSWDSWNSFRETQHKWAIAALWFFGVAFVIGFIVGLSEGH